MAPLRHRLWLGVSYCQRSVIHQAWNYEASCVICSGLASCIFVSGLVLGDWPCCARPCVNASLFTAVMVVPTSECPNANLSTWATVTKLCRAHRVHVSMSFGLILKLCVVPAHGSAPVSPCARGCTSPHVLVYVRITPAITIITIWRHYHHCRNPHWHYLHHRHYH